MCSKMKKAIQTAVLLASAALVTMSCCATEGGAVLWWMVGTGYENITGTDNKGNTKTAKELGVSDARLGYEDSSGNRTYLTLYGLDSNGIVHELEGTAGVGLPAEYFADLSGISDMECQFVLELGSWSGGQWVNTAMEAHATYADLLASKHITEWNDTAPSYGTPWTPSNFSVVPEPTSGIMVLFGTALLMLRRKRNRQDS